jgi:hypothetical protein
MMPPMSDSLPASKTHGRTAALLIILVALIGFIAAPSELFRGDPLCWMTEANSILRERSLAVPEANVGMGPVGQYFVRNPRDGRLYSKYGVGSSLAMLPPLAIMHVLDISDPAAALLIINGYYVFVSALMAWLLYRLAGRYTQRPLARLLFVLSCFYATFMWYYLRAQTMDLFLCLYFIIWFHATTRVMERGDRPRWADILTAWAMVLVMANTRPIFLALAGVSALLMGIQLWRSKAGATRLLLGAVVPAVLVAGSLALFNYVKFGAWYLTGYHQWEPSMHVPSLAHWMNLYELLVDPQFSILITFPPLLLSLFAAGRFWHAHRRDYAIALVAAVPICLIYALTLNWRGEWSAGPRYFLFALPVLALPMLHVIDGLIDHLRCWSVRIVAAGMVLLLGWSFATQALVICRPFTAYHSILLPLNGALDSGNGRLLLQLPRGIVIQRICNDLDDPEHSAFLAGVRQRLSPRDFQAYLDRLRRDVATYNIMWLDSGANMERHD